MNFHSVLSDVSVFQAHHALIDGCILALHGHSSFARACLYLLGRNDNQIRVDLDEYVLRHHNDSGDDGNGDIHSDELPSLETLHHTMALPLVEALLSDQLDYESCLRRSHSCQECTSASITCSHLTVLAPTHLGGCAIASAYRSLGLSADHLCSPDGDNPLVTNPLDEGESLEVYSLCLPSMTEEQESRIYSVTLEMDSATPLGPVNACELRSRLHMMEYDADPLSPVDFDAMHTTFLHYGLVSPASANSGLKILGGLMSKPASIADKDADEHMTKPAQKMSMYGEYQVSFSISSATCDGALYCGCGSDMPSGSRMHLFHLQTYQYAAPIAIQSSVLDRF